MIVRRRDDLSRSNSYGVSRTRTGPYDRAQQVTWREKKNNNRQGQESVRDRVGSGSAARDSVSYGQSSAQRIRPSSPPQHNGSECTSTGDTNGS